MDGLFGGEDFRRPECFQLPDLSFFPHLSVAVAVCFIALAGVAAETGVVMLIYLDSAKREALAKCLLQGRQFRVKTSTVPSWSSHPRW
ncbi:hypothetical protein RLW41_19420 [Hyphomicrobium sp. DY-1]